MRSIFAPVPDPRQARGRRYPWPALWLRLVVGLRGGANRQRAVARWGQALPRRWREPLGFTRPQGPSHPTLQRLLATIDVPQLDVVLGAWQQRVRAAWRHRTGQGLAGIAMEGTPLRKARRLSAHAVPLLSACWQRCGRVLGDVAVPAASNEVGAVAALLDALVLAGEMVTFDALCTPYVVAIQVV